MPVAACLLTQPSSATPLVANARVVVPHVIEPVAPPGAMLFGETICRGDTHHGAHLGNSSLADTGDTQLSYTAGLSDSVGRDNDHTTRLGDTDGDATTTSNHA